MLKNQARLFMKTKDKTVGVKNGPSPQNILTENQSKYGYKIKTFADGASMYDSLNTGAIDAVMDDEPVLKHHQSRTKIVNANA